MAGGCPPGTARRLRRPADRRLHRRQRPDPRRRLTGPARPGPARPGPPISTRFISILPGPTRSAPARPVTARTCNLILI